MVEISSEDLWESQDPYVWDRCLKAYWDVRSVRNNLAIEQEMDVVANCRQTLFDADARSWYRFLYDKYRPWKLKSQAKFFTDLQDKFQKRYDGARGELDALKWKLLRADKTDLTGCLQIVTLIEGFRIPTGSGLLAVLFPESFGTVDKLILRAFLTIPSVNSKYRLDAWTHNDDEYFSKGSKTDPKRYELASRLIALFTQKATENNRLVGTAHWTPRKVEMALWTTQHPDVWVRED